MIRLLALAIVVAIGGHDPAQQTPARDRTAPSKGTAIIKGQVVDEQTGAPIRRATVMAASLDAPARGDALTDDDGRFEIRELPGGRYTLSATRSSYFRVVFGQKRPNGLGEAMAVSDGATVDKIVLRMSKGGVISGRVADDYGEVVAGVQVSALQYRYENGARRLLSALGNGVSAQTDDLGQFRLWGLPPGQYYVSANPRDTIIPVGAVQAIPGTGPITTYYPSAADPAGAQRLTVAAGKETGGANITLVSSRLARVRGTALMSSGEPFRGAVMFTVRTESGSSGRTMGSIRSDGSWEARGVGAGTYLLTVRPMNARDGDDVEVARTWLTVTGEDVDNVVLVGGRGAIARGRFVTDDGALLPIPAAALTVSVMSLAPEERVTYMQPVKVSDDHSFELKGLFGRQTLQARVMAPPTSPGAPRYGFKSVMWRGDDITENGIDFQPGQVIEGLEIVFTQRSTTLAGNVTNERGEPAAEMWIVVFPSDESRWVPISRFVKAVRTNRDGAYRFQGLPAYDAYYLAVVPDVEQNQWQDPEFLQSLRERATRVSLTEGETKTQNLRIARSAQ